MKVKIKKLKEKAVIPAYAKPGDAGMDLTALSIKQEADYVTYGSGLAVEIPEGHVGLLFPRSSVWKTGMLLSNCVGVIDSGYRGEVMAKFHAPKGPLYAEGDRFAQLIIMPYPQIEFEVVEELSETERGEGGYGSTGK
jgi:dUTP pyrophosphatase